MKEIIDRIGLENTILDYVQAAYEDYNAKRDLLTMLFELHKFDEDGSIIESIPFKNYEKEFMKAKIKYDTAMKEIQKNYIPAQYQKENLRFEVNFEEGLIEIS